MVEWVCAFAAPHGPSDSEVRALDRFGFDSLEADRNHSEGCCPDVLVGVFDGSAAAWKSVSAPNNPECEVRTCSHYSYWACSHCADYRFAVLVRSQSPYGSLAR